MSEPTPIMPPPHPLEEGFLVFLLLLAIAGLFLLFLPFLPGLFLAILLAASTYGWQDRLRKRLDISSAKAAAGMTLFVLLAVVGPVSYLLMATAVRVGILVRDFRSWLDGFDSSADFVDFLRLRLEVLPVPIELKELFLSQAGSYKAVLGEKIGQGLLFLFMGLTDNAFSFLTSLLLVVFALFFLYRDGPEMVQRLVRLTPLANRYDRVIVYRFAALASVLTWSAVGIAFLQGISIGLAAVLLGLPWFYLGVAVAVTSFIPLVGGALVWGPTAYYLFLAGREGAALFIRLGRAGDGHVDRQHRSPDSDPLACRSPGGQPPGGGFGLSRSHPADGPLHPGRTHELRHPRTLHRSHDRCHGDHGLRSLRDEIQRPPGRFLKGAEREEGVFHFSWRNSRMVS
ncbi:MAG: AI-2E family transporter [Magnetococcales bacterium]|nr:AI-2E family transporter [Magnetococcales bacterium]